jgi:hypothetical protein
MKKLIYVFLIATTIASTARAEDPNCEVKKFAAKGTIGFASATGAGSIGAAHPVIAVAIFFAGIIAMLPSGEGPQSGFGQTVKAVDGKIEDAVCSAPQEKITENQESQNEQAYSFSHSTD